MDAQLNMMAEECAEFILALNHYRRGRISKEKMFEEMADVSVMVREMTIYFPEITRLAERKIMRLNRKIDREINKRLEAQTEPVEGSK
jgi:hypothetical protein